MLAYWSSWSWDAQPFDFSAMGLRLVQDFEFERSNGLALHSRACLKFLVIVLSSMLSVCLQGMHRQSNLTSRSLLLKSAELFGLQHFF